MAGATAAGSVERAAVATLRAGSDVYLVCRDLDHVWGSYQAVLREAERDRSFAEQIIGTAQRLLAFKRKMPTFLRRPVSPPSVRTVEQLRSKLQAFSEKLTNTRTEAVSDMPLSATAK